MSKRGNEERIRARMRASRPAEVTVSHWPAGQAPEQFVPGDFSLHRATATKGRGGATTALGKLIQAGERARFGNSDFARWTHSTLIVSERGDICEAIESGVALDNIEKYRGSDYLVVHVSASPVQRELACGFAKTRVGDAYGVVNFIGLAFQALFGWSLSIHMDGQFICSGLVSRATEKYIDAYPRSPENMMPGDLAYFWGATSGEPLPALGFIGRLLNLLVAFVDLFRRRKGDPAPDPGHPQPPAAPPPPAEKAAPHGGAGEQQEMVAAGRRR
ncbi:MAG: hypothetical protein E6F96_06210 [Actinobacteria bacterium]|nr:MAG: hypothetical protein E6F96_06210 [Actinomycetota bacterium]